MVPGPREEVITVLNYRLSHRTVGAIMERMYIEKREGLNGVVEYAKTGYTWRLATVDGVPWSDDLWCGSGDRVFWARKVDHLHVVEDSEGREKLSWSERKRPDLSAVREALGLSSKQEGSP